jgi:hypothetical protein
VGVRPPAAVTSMLKGRPGHDATVPAVISLVPAGMVTSVAVPVITVKGVRGVEVHAPSPNDTMNDTVRTAVSAPTTADEERGTVPFWRASDGCCDHSSCCDAGHIHVALSQCAASGGRRS